MIMGHGSTPSDPAMTHVTHPLLVTHLTHSLLWWQQSPLFNVLIRKSSFYRHLSHASFSTFFLNNHLITFIIPFWFIAFYDHSCFRFQWSILLSTSDSVSNDNLVSNDRSRFPWSIPFPMIILFPMIDFAFHDSFRLQ